MRSITEKDVIVPKRITFLPGPTIEGMQKLVTIECELDDGDRLRVAIPAIYVMGGAGAI